jgi:mycofactocin precursor
MSSYQNVNRPVRTGTAVVERVTVDVPLSGDENAYHDEPVELVSHEALVEEVSIDGMCGVY